MATFVRRTIDEALTSGYYDPSQVDRPSALLRFLRRRYTPFGGFPERALGLGLVGGAILTGGPFSPLAPIAAGAALAWHGTWGALAAPMEAGRAAVRTVRFLRRLGQGAMEFGGPVVDTRMAYTMRQSALQAMHDSAYSLRAAIGNESRLLHS